MKGEEADAEGQVSMGLEPLRKRGRRVWLEWAGLFPHNLPSSGCGQCLIFTDLLGKSAFSFLFSFI